MARDPLLGQSCVIWDGRPATQEVSASPLPPQAAFSRLPGILGVETAMPAKILIVKHNHQPNVNYTATHLGARLVHRVPGPTVW